jgi:cell division protein FtsB
VSAGSLSADGAGARRKPARRRKGARRDRRPYTRWTSGDGTRFMRALVAIFVVLLLLLQYRLWLGDGGVSELLRLKHEISLQQQENAGLRERNEALEAEVMDLKQGEAAVEERARRELGMIRRDETFYQAIDE